MRSDQAYELQLVLHAKHFFLWRGHEIYFRHFLGVSSNCSTFGVGH